jgi:hypothetical protein
MLGLTVGFASRSIVVSADSSSPVQFPVSGALTFLFAAARLIQILFGLKCGFASAVVQPSQGSMEVARMFAGLNLLASAAMRTR